MATLDQLTLDADGTIGSDVEHDAGTGAPFFSHCNDAPDGVSSDWVSNNLTERTTTARFRLTDVNSDFGNMDTLNIDVDVELTGSVDNDTIVLSARIFDADDEVTPLTDETTTNLGDETDTTRAQRNVTFGGLTGTKAQWNTAHIQFTWTYDKTGGGDNIRLQLFGCDIDGTYTAVIPFTPEVAAFRFYDDDGDEDGSTQLAAQDTNVTVDAADADDIVHLRLRVDETTGGVGLTTDDWQLQYEKNATGGFFDVNNSSSNVKSPDTVGSTPVLESHTENINTSQSATLTLTKPGSVATDDLLILLVGSESTSPDQFTDNVTGWNFHDPVHEDTLNHALYWRIADGDSEAEASTIDVVTASSQGLMGYYLRISGADTSDPFSGGFVDTLPDDLTVHTLLEVTTDRNNCLCFYQEIAGDDGTTYSVASPWTETDEGTGSISGQIISGSFGTQALATAGASGDAVITASTTVGAGGTVFAVQPAFVSGSQLTDGGATTDRSSDPISNPGGGSFVAGEQESANGLIENSQLTADNFTEHVWALKLLSTNLATDDTLDFRLRLNGGAITNDFVPRITIGGFGWYQSFSTPYLEPTSPQQYVQPFVFVEDTGGVTVSVTGVSVTGSVGTVTITSDFNTIDWYAPLSEPYFEPPTYIIPAPPYISFEINVPVTGVFATGATGTAIATGDALVSVTGVQATGSIGAVTITVEFLTIDWYQEFSTPYFEPPTYIIPAPPHISFGEIVSVTGEAATGSTGTVIATGDAIVPVTGVQATGNTGTVSITDGFLTIDWYQEFSTPYFEPPTYIIPAPPYISFGITVPVTGEQVTGAVGTVTATGNALVSVTGVQATGSTGTVTVTANFNTLDWYQEFSEPYFTPIHIPPYLQTTITVIGDVVVAVTGQQVTGSVGAVTVTADFNTIDWYQSLSTPYFEPTPPQRYIQSFVISELNVTVLATGAQATGSVGDESVRGDAIVPPIFLLDEDGSILLDEDGTPLLDENSLAVFATGSVGNVTITEDFTTLDWYQEFSVPYFEPLIFVAPAPQYISFEIDVPVTGVSATGSTGTVAVVADFNTIDWYQSFSEPYFTPIQVPPYLQTTIAPIADVTVSVTGVQVAGFVGAVTVTADFTTVDWHAPFSTPYFEIPTYIIPAPPYISFEIDVPVTGVFATGSVGTAVATGDALVSVTGVSATGSTGTVVVTADFNTIDWYQKFSTPHFEPTPVQQYTQPFLALVVVNETVSVTGVQATGSVGTASVTADFNTVDWYGPFSVPYFEPIPVQQYTVPFVKSEEDTTVLVTGLFATGSVGDVTVTAEFLTIDWYGPFSVPYFEPTPVQQYTPPYISFEINVPVTGVFATGSTGTVTATGDAVVSVTGVQATGSTGTVAVTADFNTIDWFQEFSTPHFEPQFYISLVPVHIVVPRITVSVTGVQAVSLVGSEGVRGDAFVDVVGTCVTAVVNFPGWADVADPNDSTWTNIPGDSGNTWSGVSGDSGNTWADIPGDSGNTWSNVPDGKAKFWKKVT